LGDIKARIIANSTTGTSRRGPNGQSPRDASAVLGDELNVKEAIERTRLTGNCRLLSMIGTIIKSKRSNINRHLEQKQRVLEKYEFREINKYK